MARVCDLCLRICAPGSGRSLILIQQLAAGQWQGINPLIVALFNLMGLWPMIYACVVLVDGCGQRVPAWPFVVASFGVGAFALLPYVALRRSPAPSAIPNTALLRLTESRWTGAAIALGVVVLLGYGLAKGDWADFIQQWHTSRFIHVMSLDFCVLSLVFPVLLADDLARRGMTQSWIFWAVAIAPLVGPALYLGLRSPIPLAAPENAIAPSTDS